MPLPAGYVEEDTLDMPQDNRGHNLPPGYVEEDRSVSEIKQAPSRGIFEKVVGFFRDPEREIAKAQNIYALSEVTGLPLREVNKNYEVLRRSTKVTGLTPDLDKKEYMQTILLPGIAVGAVTNPIGTAAGIIAYGALDKAIPTEKLINNLREQGINDDITTAIELADIVGKGMIVGGVFRKAPKVAEGFLKQKFTEYKMPETISLTAQQVKDVYQTGRLTTSEQQSLFGGLELNSFDRRAALEHGININMPAEKIVRLVDKPFWAKIKGMFGISSAAEITTLPVEKPTKAPAGFLELKPQELSIFYNNLKDIRLGVSNQAHILDLPVAIATERKIPRSIYIDQKMINKLEGKHNLAVDENFINNLSSADLLIFPEKEPGKMNFVKNLESGKALVVATKRYNGHFIITGFEVVDPKYVESLKKRGEVINLAERAPISSIETPSSESASQPELPGVSKTLTSPKQNIQQVESIVKGKILSSGDSVQKVITALKEAKDLRSEQETLYAKARKEKFAKMQAVGEKVRGEKGFYAQLGALKGELPKVEFEAIRNKITQEDIDVLFNMVKDSPKIGEWEKLAAREGLAKLFGEYGGKVPTENEIALLNQVFGEEFTKAILQKKTLLEKMKYAGAQIANIPRSLMASFDLSAPLRQGIFLIGRPKQFLPAFKRMFGAFKSEVAYEAIQDAIIAHPDYQLARDSHLALTDMDVLLGTREEVFMSNWAEKIPLVGKGVKASERAYIGFLNKLRFDVFADLINKAEMAGLKPRENRDLAKAIADFVNNATGRGTLPYGLQKSAIMLNNVFFSPRLIISRLNLLNPHYYIKQTPFVRKEALKSLFSFVSIGIAILALLKMAGVEVGDDPRSSDFGKIKIGNTRIDIWGGFQPLVRGAAQIITGKYISSTTGKEMTLGEGYKPMTRADIVQRFLEGKLAPIPSFVVTLLKQKDISGEDVSVPKEIAERFIPMVMQDMYDLAQESPGLLPVSILAVFGAGVQTYEQKSYR